MMGTDQGVDSKSKEILEDYSLRPVPEEQKKRWIDMAVVWIGVAVVMSALLRGMMIGLGLGSINRVLLAYGLGELILILIMIFTGYLGARTGLSTPLLASQTFGSRGALLISLLLGLAFLGWFAVQAGLFAETMAVFFPWSFSRIWLSLASGLAMMLPVLFGFRGLKALSWLAVPPMLLAFFYAAFKVGFKFLPRPELIRLAQAHQPSPYPLNLGEAASLVAGGFIVGAVTSADIFRYARPRWVEVAAAATMAMVVSALMQLTGSTLAMATGLYHEELPRIIINQEFAGLGFLGFLAIALAQWTTNDSNLYSSVLAFKNLVRVRRWKLTLLLGLAASVLAAAGWLNRLSLFLSLLAIACGPVGGILLVDHYLIRKKNVPERKAEIFRHENNSSGLNWIALIAYFLGFLSGWLTSGHPWRLALFPFSIFAFNGILGGGFFYGSLKLLEKYLKNRKRKEK